MKVPKVKLWRILLETCLLLIIINFIYPSFGFIPFAKFSLYNHIFPGRQRLPFGENPQLSYNLTLNDIDAMLASHIAADSNAEKEYSIYLVGDSSVWGTLLKNDATLSSYLQNLLNQTYPKNGINSIKVYNFGYPTSSVLKDLVLLDESLKYKPDMIIWFVTLNSLIEGSYKEAPLLLANPEKTNLAIEKYNLAFSLLPKRTFLEKTLLMQRRNIYDRIRLQLLGFMWAATEIDQYIPQEYQVAARDLEQDDSYQFLKDHSLSEEDLDLSIVTNFVAQNPQIKVIIVNEPILISRGRNSAIRYDTYYPRWAYDAYRDILSSKLSEMGIKYIDLWDAVPETFFTNSAIHYNEEGVRIVTEKIYAFLMRDLEIQ